MKNYLFQAIDRTILETILDKESSKSIWDLMKQKYQGTTKVRRAQLQALRREFELLQMLEGEKVDEYFARTLTIANKMKMHGEKMGQVTVVEKILRTMTQRFNYVVCSIEESNDLDKMTIDELQSSLLVHEQKMNGHVADEQALKVSYESNYGGRGRGSNRDRGRGRGRGRHFFNRATVECFKCHKLGHFSNHICGNKLWFSNFDETFRHSVKLGNNLKMMVMGKGNIRLEINGLIHIVTNVYYVPELKSNLLSMGQLQEKGLAMLIQHGECKVYHPEEGLIMAIKMTGTACLS